MEPKKKAASARSLEQRVATLEKRLALLEGTASVEKLTTKANAVMAATRRDLDIAEGALRQFWSDMRNYEAYGREEPSLLRSILIEVGFGLVAGFLGGAVGAVAYQAVKSRLSNIQLKRPLSARMTNALEGGGPESGTNAFESGPGPVKDRIVDTQPRGLEDPDNKSAAAVEALVGRLVRERPEVLVRKPEEDSLAWFYRVCTAALALSAPSRSANHWYATFAIGWLRVVQATQPGTRAGTVYLGDAMASLGRAEPREVNPTLKLPLPVLTRLIESARGKRVLDVAWHVSLHVGPGRIVYDPLTKLFSPEKEVASVGQWARYGGNMRWGKSTRNFSKHESNELAGKDFAQWMFKNHDVEVGKIRPA